MPTPDQPFDATLTVSWNEADLSKRRHAETILGDALHAAGLGVSDGGDISVDPTRPPATSWFQWKWHRNGPKRRPLRQPQMTAWFFVRGDRLEEVGALVLFLLAGDERLAGWELSVYPPDPA